jgi:hypothetical protein
MAATLAGDPQETPGPSLLERAITRMVVEYGEAAGFCGPGSSEEGMGPGRPETPFWGGAPARSASGGTAP